MQHSDVRDRRFSSCLLDCIPCFVCPTRRWGDVYEASTQFAVRRDSAATGQCSTSGDLEQLNCNHGNRATVITKGMATSCSSRPFANAILQAEGLRSARVPQSGDVAGILTPRIQEQFVAKRPTLTTISGMPVADNQNSITAGPRGPVLMQDFH